MADETENQDITEEPQAAAEEAAPEAPAEEPAAEPAAEAPAEEPAAEAPEEAPAADGADAPAAEAEPPAEPAEPEEILHPKERRRRARSQHTETRPERAPDERQDERRELRRAKSAARSRRRAQEREKKAATPNGEGTPPAEHTPGNPQVRQGVVVSDKADKTITVSVDIAKRHPRYQKIVRSTKTVHAHDEANDARAGDIVRVVECRPMSRTKRWRLVEILERAK
jgi:small subunit ribosomal protein S17